MATRLRGADPSDLAMVVGLLLLATGVSLRFGYDVALMLVGAAVLAMGYLAGRH